MKKYLLISTLILIFGSVQAQKWQTDFKLATEMAALESKPIVLVFSGSDWCAPCMKLEKEIWSTTDFINYSNEHYILLKADFPRKSKNTVDAQQKEANKQLAERYNKNGFFPLVVVLDKQGKAYGSLGYKKVSPKEYIALIDAMVK
jgi:thioredoxin-related protein